MSVETRTCENCSVHFQFRPTRGHAGRFCSKQCLHTHMRCEAERHRVDAFWAKVEKTETCWVWTASKDECGYGFATVVSRRAERAHRVAWRMAHGDIPRGLCVLHRCDNPPCVNPAHLFLGTREDNMRDRQRKMRQAHGERHHRARLTTSQVIQARELRASGSRIKDIAARFSVSPATVSHLCSGRTWRHV